MLGLHKATAAVLVRWLLGAGGEQEMSAFAMFGYVGNDEIHQEQGRSVDKLHRFPMAFAYLFLQTDLL